MKKKRILIVGLDGVTWRLLDPMIADGFLPNLSRLKAHGAWGELESTMPPVTATAWSSFQTGVMPGAHGATDFNVYNGASYKMHPLSSVDIPQDTIWQILSKAGKRVVTVNVPVTYPARPVNGCVVTGILTPDLNSAFTYPAGLADDIRRLFPSYTILTPQTDYNTARLSEFLNNCVATEQIRADVFEYLLSEKCPDWDVAMLHVQETDIIQHAVYWLMDKDGPYFSAEAYRAIGKAYKAFDDIVGRVHQLADDDTLFIVLSDHGHTPVYRTLNVNSFLARDGFLTFNDSTARSILRRAIGLALRLDKWNLNRRLRRFGRRKLVDTLNQDVAVRWDKTRAFMLNGWVWANIFLNVAGREPRGVVKPGREYAEVRKQVAQAMRNLRDPENGRFVFRRVLTHEEAFPGAVADRGARVPDLIGEPTEGYEFSSSFYQGVEELFRSNRLRRDHTGSHSMDGILAVSGPDSANRLVEQSALIDLFPTILAWLDLPIPSYAAGNVLHDLFERPIHVTHQTAQNSDGQPGKENAGRRAGHGAYSDSDRRAIEERLRALGYMAD